MDHGVWVGIRHRESKGVGPEAEPQVQAEQTFSAR